MALDFSAGYDGRGRVTANLSLFCSLRREPRSGRWRADSRRLATQGVASARVFLDKNLNGRFDAGDRPLTGVGISAGGSPSSTDAEGIALLTGLPTDRQVHLDLAVGSLVDPYWIPTRPAIGLVARPGRVAAVDFPVVASSEIDGTVRLRRGEGLQEVSKVRLQLLDSSGAVVSQAESSFDGFYLFERLLPGCYTLRVDPEQLSRLHLASPPERKIALGGGEVVSGVDFVLAPGP